MSKKKSSQNNNETAEPIRLTAENELRGKDLLSSFRKDVRELIAPHGVNTAPLEYMELLDRDSKVYVICYYVHKMPSMLTLATSFAPLFNYPHVTSNVIVDPMMEGKASKIMDARVNQIETELISAEKYGNSNQIRKLQTKLKNANRSAKMVETGQIRNYDVAIMFALYDTDLDSLYVRAADFHSLAKENRIDLVSCYSAHPEAFLSLAPTNRIFTPSIGLLKGMSVKTHTMDQFGLGTLFNHTRNDFSHKNGFPVGHNISSGQLALYDPFDKSHDGYGVCYSGKTGSGKSASIKMFASRMTDFGIRIRSIDFEPKGSTGEYYPACAACGGINYQFSPKSSNILNPYDVDVEYVYDEHTQTEYQELNLSEMLSNLTNVYITLLKDGKEINDFSLYTFVKEIILNINHRLYTERGIYDGVPDSIYQTDNVKASAAFLSSGKVKKAMPTITDFYKSLLQAQAENENELYTLPYQLIASGMREYVRFLAYTIVGGKCIFFTEEEYEALMADEHGKFATINGVAAPVHYIKGSKPYFDGQSTVFASPDTPWINFDLSQIVEAERNTALIVVMNYLDSNIVRKNSKNPLKAQKMIIIIDEMHKTFKILEARQFLASAYRTYRKCNVSPWAITQSILDFDGFEETRTILKQSTSKFLFRQDLGDKDFMLEYTPLTSSQVERVCSLGESDETDDDSRRGEVCLIDNNKVCFLKVDYLTGSESLIVETDINKIQKMYAGAHN